MTDEGKSTAHLLHEVRVLRQQVAALQAAIAAHKQAEGEAARFSRLFQTSTDSIVLNAAP